jgi:parallel beta-helix repeat protein
LTIQAGSDLLIDKSDMEIDVLGTLRTNGTAQAPVVIQPNSRTPESGDWTGLIVTPDGPTPLVRLYHTDILYAKDAIFAVPGSEVRLNGCRIEFSSEFGVLFQSAQDLHVVNSTIKSNAKSGIRIGGPAATPPDSVVLSGNILNLNGDTSGETTYTDQAAIYIDIPDYSRNSAIRILNNEISNNGFPAIHLVRACYPEIRDNAIFSNELGKIGQKYAIRLQNGFGVGGPQDTIGARLNYWGSPYTNPATDSLLIKKTIWDSEDAPAGIAVRVIVYPWLHAAP